VTKKEFIRHLEARGSCYGCVEWAKDSPGTPKSVWDSCNRHPWLKGLILALGIDFDWTAYWQYEEERRRFHITGPGLHPAAGWIQYEQASEALEIDRCNYIRERVPWSTVEKKLNENPTYGR